jgi:dTDP-4-amino-4,6-dideoxygalactose transaminase
MDIPFNTLKPQYERYAGEYLAAAKRVLESGWYILGGEVDSFEREFAGYLGARHCIGVASGLDALILGLRALGVGAGDEVIVPANTYIATALAVTEVGAEPVFVEPDEYYCIDADRIESAITPKTAAVIAVHLYGQSCDMRKICETARKNGLYVVEDCAQSHGVTFEGRMTGTFGDVGCFSFFPTKGLGAFGDAGGVVTDDSELDKKIRMLRNYGSSVKYINEIPGVNSRLDEIQAALLRVKLRHLDELAEERSRIANCYLERIANPEVVCPKIRPGSTHCWHQFVIRNERRDELQENLKKNGIGTQIHYPIPPHLSGAYEGMGFKRGSFPITEKYADTALSLPVFNGMQAGELCHICDVLNGDSGSNAD